MLNIVDVFVNNVGSFRIFRFGDIKHEKLLSMVLYSLTFTFSWRLSERYLGWSLPFKCFVFFLARILKDGVLICS